MIFVSMKSFVSRKRDSNPVPIPSVNPDSNLMANSLSVKNNHAIETLISKILHLIRSKKELKHSPFDIVLELERFIINYQ